MQTSARCPRCDNWAPIAKGVIGSHKSNRFNGKGKLLGCPAAGRTLEQEKADLTPEKVMVRNHLKRQRQAGLSGKLKLDLPPAPGRYRHVARHCVPCDKDLYGSLAQAQRMIRKILNLRGVELFVYRCPEDGENYHLTKMEDHDDRGEVL